MIAALGLAEAAEFVNLHGDPADWIPATWESYDVVVPHGVIDDGEDDEL